MQGVCGKNLEDATSEVDPHLIVANKGSRVDELVERLSRILKEDKLTSQEAARLRRRLVFANSQTFGRLGALAFHYWGVLSSSPGSPSACRN